MCLACIQNNATAKEKGKRKKGKKGKGNTTTADAGRATGRANIASERLRGGKGGPRHPHGEGSLGLGENERSQASW